jgi:hypothetical protein
MSSVSPVNHPLFSHCEEFIGLVSHPKANYIAKVQSCAEQILLDDLPECSSPEQQEQVKTLFEQLKAVQTSKNPKVQECVKEVFQKLGNLYKSISIKASGSALTPTPQIPSFAGMQNKSGSDCFLISLCQLLRLPSLREHLVDRLPIELWQPLVADNPHATFIRKAIVENTAFGVTIDTNVHANPLNSQLDPEEVLAFLLSRLDEPDLSYDGPKLPSTSKTLTPQSPAAVTQDLLPTSSVPTLSLKEAYQENYTKATNILQKMRLFFVFWVSLLVQKMQDYFHTLFTSGKAYTVDPSEETPEATPPALATEEEAAEEPEEDPLANYTPVITANHPDNRPLKDPAQPFIDLPNPLRVEVKKTRTYQPQKASQMPAEVINHDNFGGPSHQTFTIERDPFLSLPVTKRTSRDKKYTLNTLLRKYFSSTSQDDLSSVTVKGDNGQETIYTAKRKEKIQLSSIPQHLLLSFRRSIPNGEKIDNPIEGIDLTFTLPKDLLETPAEDKDLQYQLEGFICHQGTSSSGGHYVAYRKEADGWHHFDDSHHEKVSEEDVKEAVKHSYIVFYKHQS